MRYGTSMNLLISASYIRRGFLILERRSSRGTGGEHEASMVGRFFWVEEQIPILKLIY